MTTNILGISAYYHDSAAALVQDGKIIAAAQEERFTRKKHDARFPSQAIDYCLKTADIKLENLSQIVFYDKPLVKFERLLETYLAYAPHGFISFLAAMPVWMKEKLFLKTVLKRELAEISDCKVSELPPLLFTEHHQAHAASAFFPSPFDRAAVLCLDGVGEWATTSIWLGEGNQLTSKWEIDFPHSLGLLYSAFTYYTGFKVNSGEYKLMGLAPYGEPKYVDLILDHLIDLKPDGTFRLDMSYFNFAIGLTMTNHKFDNLFGGAPRKPEANLTQREMDIASSIQVVTEEVVLRLCRTVRQELDVDYLCLAGGVALNCVANGHILRSKVFKDIWIQPAAGDAGGAIGAALATWHQYLEEPRHVETHQQSAAGAEFLTGNDQLIENGYARNGYASTMHHPQSTSQEIDQVGDRMQGTYLGPCYSNAEIRHDLESVGAVYQELDDRELMPHLAKILAQGNVVGWFQGRMEFGPRSLGGRSIIGDARNPKMQSVMNLKIKYRESFRPFAPSVLAERVTDYFDLDSPSPYMLLVANVKQSLHHPINPEQSQLFGIEQLNISRSQIPAVTHIDYSARVQTVHKETNPRYHALLSEFDALTGCAVLVNTSFNVRGEPIVCTPEQAYQCFMRTEMDYLVLENCLLSKYQQPQLERDHSWQKEFELD